MVKEAHKIKFGSTTLFDGTREMYSFWRTKQIAAVHGQKMTIANKALAVVDALDLKTSQTLKDLVRLLQYDATTYINLLRQLERYFGGKGSDLAISATALIHGKKIDLRKKASVTEVAAKLQAHRELLRAYGKDKTEFAESSQLYRDMIRERMDDDAHRDFQKYRQDNKLDRSPRGCGFT
jgi:hypothetical protein